MYFRKNTNTAYCSHSIANNGECCCNCQYFIEMIHPVFGTVAFGCSIFGFSNIQVKMPHGNLCECHEFPNIQDNNDNN